MIVEFNVKNFRSIKELQTISFVATGLKSAERYSEVDANNIAVADDMKLFKTLGIYGANASGKSNVIKALDLFHKVIDKEPSSNSNLSDINDPFLFQDDEVTECFF
jgi:AAA15 family ATPase/GTPase